MKTPLGIEVVQHFRQDTSFKLSKKEREKMQNSIVFASFVFCSFLFSVSYCAPAQLQDVQQHQQQQQAAAAVAAIEKLLLREKMMARMETFGRRLSNAWQHLTNPLEPSDGLNLANRYRAEAEETMAAMAGEGERDVAEEQAIETLLPLVIKLLPTLVDLFSDSSSG